ncbi:unnamed protein product [Rotaria sordida]|uniref:Uncharacterized protein n=1 Tax=Rotaria sordida TaxID=392033 RepID=A0A814ZT18_9BILA|nr:unnamed protein product [Rotaria sordida]
MLLFQVLITTLISTPYFALAIYNAIAVVMFRNKLSPSALAIYNFAQDLSRLLHYTNPVITFYIYTLTGPKFRVEMKRCIQHGLKSVLTAIGLMRCLPLRAQQALLGQSSSNIYERMVVVYGDNVPSYTTVFEGARRFKDAQLTIEDDPKSGRPITTTNDQTIKVVKNLAIEDRRITIQQIADTLSILTGTVHDILHEQSHITKFCSRWVPHLLTPDQRHERVEACQELLACYSIEKNHFLFRIITGDELLFSYYQPESKRSSKQWKQAGSPPPTKLKQEKSTNKVLYSFFWNYKGIILKEPVPVGYDNNEDI